MLLTGKLALYSTTILFVAGLPLAYLLSSRRFFAKSFVEALISVPMVLPPIVLGFYLLLLYSPTSVFGGWLESVFGIRLAFSFEGILIASIISTLPITVHPLRAGFDAIPPNLSEVAQTLGRSNIDIFFRVLIPNMVPSIVTSLALSFAHCIGEFGVIIMVGGSIVGETMVASIAIYDQVQALNYEAAHEYSFALFVISVTLLTAIYSFNRRFREHVKR